jgi:Ca-activated chloride channel homolog
MMRALLAFVLFAFMLPAQAGMNWSGLWRNPDQQGEALMQQGDAAAAAKVYRDTRRKAYAELKAGDYATAARDLAAFDDSDAHYNRGNALAHAGDLQGAIDAYEAALKRDPHNRDAIQNRKLVENALKKQSQKQQDSGNDQSKQGKPGQQNKSGKESNSKGQNGNSRNPSAQGQGQPDQGKQGKSSANQQAQPGSAGDQSSKDRNASRQKDAAQGDSKQQGMAGDQPKDGKQSEQSGRMQTGQTADNTKDKNASAQGLSGKQSQQGGKTNAGDNQQAAQIDRTKNHDDAAQTRRDAAAGVDYANSANHNGKVSDKDSRAPAGRDAGLTPAAPKSEQQLAQDQWLRSIPDDPGGLLRRKFMIEYMLRQQKEQP